MIYIYIYVCMYKSHICLRPEKPEPAEQRGRRPRRRGAGHEAGDNY